MPWTMFNHEGQRKYLTRVETASFLAAARQSDAAVASFCWVMAATGCRISEALAVTPGNIDFESKHLIIESLKKRGKRIYRAVPLPAALLDVLRKGLADGTLGKERCWPWSRMTGYRRICEAMDAAGVVGAYATPKGLRHAFGVGAIQAQVPLNMVQRWLGHADMKTTAIYTSAIGPEERAIAARMWGDDTEAPDTERNDISPAYSSGDGTTRSPGCKCNILNKDSEFQQTTGEPDMLFALRRDFEIAATSAPSSNDGCKLIHFELDCHKFYVLLSST